MFRWLRHLRLWLSRLFRLDPRTEPSRLIVGSTGSGKSEGELVELVRLAEKNDTTVILLDGHGPLALRAAGHWAAGGHESRMIYEPLDTTDRVLCWNMLPKSNAGSLSRRRIEDSETKDEVTQCFLSQRGEETLANRPWTKEWLEAAIALCLAQPQPEPLGSLLSAFHVGRADYERLLAQCEDQDIVAKFREMERLRRRNAVQYELQTGPSRRLIELICTSEVSRLRCRPGPFDWLHALQERALIAFDGGGIRSRELKRTLFLLVSMHVIHAVRCHFAQTQQPLPVVLVLEEAGALGLVTPFIVHAEQELRKAGLAVHLITQSTLDFGDRTLFESLLAHTPWQAWYQCLAPADQELGGKALGNATFDAHTVHFTRTRAVQAGSERTTAAGRGTYRGMFRTRYKQIAEAYYKTPQLHEQEYRTQLATLRIGERIVRDREGVRREQVIPLRPPRVASDVQAFTRAAIERIRRQPIYLPCLPLPQPSHPEPLPDAAARLRRNTDLSG